MAPSIKTLSVLIVTLVVMAINILVIGFYDKSSSSNITTKYCPNVGDSKVGQIPDSQ